MPTTAHDLRALRGMVVMMAAGLALLIAGVILDPPLALLRHLHKEN
jgi:hypothetical protein